MTTPRNANQNLPGSLITNNDLTLVNKISELDGSLSAQAKALLSVNEGKTLQDAADDAGLSRNQVKYILTKYRRSGLSMFPDYVVTSLRSQVPEERENVKKPAQDKIEVSEEKGKEKGKRKGKGKGKNKKEKAVGRKSKDKSSNKKKNRKKKGKEEDKKSKETKKIKAKKKDKKPKDESKSSKKKSSESKKKRDKSNQINLKEDYSNFLAGKSKKGKKTKKKGKKK